MVMWLQVLLNLPLNQVFTYKVPEKEGKVSNDKIQIGLRVEVMFGRRKMTGFIIKVLDSLPENFDYPVEKIKPALRIIDEQPLFTTEQIELAKWLSMYYVCSVGEALSIMIPSGRRETDTGGFSFSQDAIEFEKRVLSDEQKTAVDEILKTKDLHYLYGNTGSGKTEVFLTVAENILSQGKGVIYLVPEIGLTHQVIEAVIRRFGQTAAVLHSGLTGSQKLKEWHRILTKEARVIIGARSAIFAPVPDLGLIIIDEEHDGSYKSGTTPRYHARQVAMYRCAKLNIPLLMGSATPSAESWHFMQKGVIKKHTLTKRLSGGKPPEIEVVNLSEIVCDGCISPKLESEMRSTLDEGRQTILFLNRRGFTHFFKCNSCGYELKCKNCSVPLTYHKSENKLRCHYCGWQIEPPTTCPECSSFDITYSGFGTEFIEQEVRAKFPTAKIQRIDTDTLTKKGEFQECLDDFRQGKIDILLGTQMVAKGLNFPKLKLVGVVMADTGLHLPDFRASERTFSLIVQVAGRAGRFFPDGKVIVQTYDPYRAAIAFACKNDIDGFYNYELSEREMLDFPPFARLIRLVFRSADKNLAEQSATQALEILKTYSDKLEQAQQPSFDILGPAECPLAKIAANYRYQLLLKSNVMPPMQKAVANLLYSYKSPTGIYMEVDADPVSLL